MKRWAKVTVVVCVVLAVGATAAWATGLTGRFVASDGSITACVRNLDGSVRFVGPYVPPRPSAACRSGETAVTFNQKGQKGDPGALTDASALSGLACSTAGGTPGETGLTFGDNGAATLFCDTGTGAPAVCGDGTTKSPEACDSGGSDSATCNHFTCTHAICGDGYVNAAAGEQCDVGGSADTSYCVASTCKVSTCGDGHTNLAAGEACDPGGFDTASCNGYTCHISACGDGYVNKAAGEQCDDGASNGNSDACLANCTLNPTPP